MSPQGLALHSASGSLSVGSLFRWPGKMTPANPGFILVLVKVLGKSEPEPRGYLPRTKRISTHLSVHTYAHLSIYLSILLKL